MYITRIEDTSREGVILDTTLQKRKLSKTRKTVDFDDYPYSPYYSFGRTNENAPENIFTKVTLSDRKPNVSVVTNSSKSEVWNYNVHEDLDLEQDASKSAPPVVERHSSSFTLYNDLPEVSDSAYYTDYPSKPTVSRTSIITHRPWTEVNVDRAAESKKRDSKSEVTKRDIRSSEGLYYLPPVRRDPRLNIDSNSAQRRITDPGIRTRVDIRYQDNIVELHQDDDSKTEDKKQPEVPLRAIRKPRREIVCRSVGEEVTDSAISPESKRAMLLSTIKESGLTSADLLAKQVWMPRKECENIISSAQLIQQEAHLVDYTKTALVPSKRTKSVTTLDLRRRNSDPATTKIAVVEQPGGPEHSPQAKLAPGTDKLDWISRTSFTYAGHRFNKVSRFSKDDRCVYCNEGMDAFVTQGHKCSLCKKMFHTKCIQNRGVLEMPCEMRSTSGSDGGKPRRKYRKYSQTPYDMNKQVVTSKFSLTGTSEFTDRTDKIISDARELQLMQDFITNKICKMENQEKGQETQGKKPSEVDRVFKQALREFKDNLVATYSVVNKQGLESLNIKYKDLIANFLHVMETVCHQEQKEEDFPVTMGVNAFRGFMNEFMTSRSEPEKPSKTKRKKEKKRKIEDPISFSGHSFVLTIINIPTACEICSSFFMWPIERGLVCQSCKLTCHKKCYNKATGDCGKDSNHAHDSRKVFGIPLASLLTGECKIPVVLDRLITTIEMHGLYTEGIYRKSGVNSKVRELKTRMEESDQDEVNFEDYQMHVLASVLKGFLREMPEPLLTFDCYEDFLRAASLTEQQDRIATLFEILKKLPKSNFDLMERLIFHLARVALHEDVNRMNSSALAIVFAPCILRTNKILPAQDSLNDIGRQTQCIETILMEQLRKVRSTLADIDTLDTACHTATHRLSSLRSSKVFSPEELQPASHQAQQSPQSVEGEDEEALLVGHIQEIQKEKELLTSALPSLTRTTSDDDMLSTDLDGEGSLDDISCTGQLTDLTPSLRRPKGPVVRSVSGGDPRQTLPPKLKRQSSSDISVVKVEECEDAPIMV